MSQQTDFIDLISKLSSLGTLLLGIYAVKEYRNKVSNKVNGRQLDEVICLINKLRNTSIKVIKYDNEYEDVDMFFTNLIQISEDYAKGKYNKNFKLLLPIDYKIPDARIPIKKLFSDYKNKPLIPKSIVYILRELDLTDLDKRISNNTIKSHNTVNKESIKYDVPINPKDIKLSGNFDKGYILIDPDESDLCQYNDIGDEENFFEFYSGAEELVINTDIQNPYQDWETFQRFCHNLTQEIKQWLEDNNVKDVNLPDLDQEKTYKNDIFGKLRSLFTSYRKF